MGKTCVSRALAQSLAMAHRKTLWATIEDPSLPRGKVREEAENLFTLNCDAETAFEEYVGIKLKIKALARLFTRNRLMKFLSQAGPGIHELVILGKLWYERKNYDHVVIDMPSTGFGIAMYESARNFSNLFQGGTIWQDTVDILSTLRSAEECTHIIVAIPEEMPLQEAIEFDEYLNELFPKNPRGFIVNRVFPKVTPAIQHPHAEGDPFVHSTKDYAQRRNELEERNLEAFRSKHISFLTLNLEPHSQVEKALIQQLKSRGWV